VTVVSSFDVLCFYCHWFCSTDITVGFVGLMFRTLKIDSPYDKSVTVTETVFTKDACLRVLVKNCHTEIHENSTEI